MEFVHSQGRDGAEFGIIGIYTEEEHPEEFDDIIKFLVDNPNVYRVIIEIPNPDKPKHYIESIIARRTIV